MPIWGQLKRRDVVKVAVAYLVASWLIIQVVGVLTDPLELPDELDTVVVVLLAIGFPVALIIAWIYEVTPEGIRVTTRDGKNRASASGQRLTYVVVGLFLVATGLMVANRLVTDSNSMRFGAGSRLAVLPCDDLSPDPSNAFFAVGIHEELLNQLSSISDLNVISRTSVLPYSGVRPPIPQIAEELEVQAVIECSARYSGDRVLLTVQLIDGDSDTNLWAESFPGDMSNVDALFEIQAEIAMNVANALNVEFFDSERERIERVPTESPLAYDAFLRGRAYMARGQAESATDAFKRAVDLDAEFGEAWLRLADAYSTIQAFQASEELRDLQAEATNKALELLPGGWEPHLLRALRLFGERDWIDAARSFELAKSLDPPADWSWVASYAGGYLVHVGRVQEAATIYTEARSLDPLSPAYSSQTAWALDLAGRNEEALAEFERAQELSGGESLYLLQHFHALLVEGDNARMDAFFSSLPAENVLRQFQDIWQSPPATIELLRDLFDDADSQFPALLPGWAPVAAYSGDLELAIEFMREAYVHRNINYFVYAWHPLMSGARAMPAFKELIVELGLDEIWREVEWADACRPLGDDDFECF